MPPPGGAAQGPDKLNFNAMKQELRQLFNDHNNYDMNNYIKEEEMGSDGPVEPSGLFYDSDYDEKNRYKDSSDEEAIYQRDHSHDPFDPNNELNLSKLTKTD